MKFPLPIRCFPENAADHSLQRLEKIARHYATGVLQKAMKEIEHELP